MTKRFIQEHRFKNTINFIYSLLKMQILINMQLDLPVDLQFTIKLH